ncbi:MAG: DNA recombination protein RmuC [Bacteroidetes bacterium HGW-Bacteroidetes-12]|nr:MAG: DNA recombination protein RmuC [Bacteroidetes bacterium HGW-Bacteroidetes-12]
MEITSVILLFVGLILGFVIGFLVKKNNSSSETGSSIVDELQQKITVLSTENGALNGRIETSREVFKAQEEKFIALENEKNKLLSDNARLENANQNIENKLKEHKGELEQLQEKFTTEFSLIANKLLKQNASEFAETNEKRLSEILNPLKENIKQFEQKVDNNYEKEFKERTSLIEQIKSLEKLNIQMSEEAQNLTRALKGDNKAQGNWGELILEKVLESSGLIKDEEYSTQYSTTAEEGNRVQPDVIINLPENKHIIIDAKVSLIAYQNYINSEVEEEIQSHLKNHVLSVKNHIKGLSEKHYITAKGMDTPDFVLLFMPIESSFGLALRTDNELYQYAWDRKVVIVTPSTLLATLRTVASLWKQEKQTKNALEIARQAGALHNKFVSFLEDLERIKKGIELSNDAYDKAYNKLKSGKGNLIDATQKLEKLGIKTKKQLPENLLTLNENEDEEI